MSEEVKQPEVGRHVYFNSPLGSKCAHVVAVSENYVSLQVFLDGTNDLETDPSPTFSREECERGMAWKTSVFHVSHASGSESFGWDYMPYTKEQMKKAETKEDEPAPHIRDVKLAEIMFDAYNVQAGGKTWDGKDIPPYAEVGEKVQGNWIAAAKAAREAICNDIIAESPDAPAEPVEEGEAEESTEEKMTMKVVGHFAAGSEFESELIALMYKWGFKSTGSGTELKNDIRDISFSKEIS